MALATLAGAIACSTDRDCSLNGVCSAGACSCDPGWDGEQCTQLKLLPVRNAFGYRNSTTSTWGGNIIEWPDKDGSSQYPCG